MELGRLWVLRGPNAWAACPMIEAGLDLGPWAGRSADDIGQVAGCLLAWIPSLAPHLAGRQHKEAIGCDGKPALNLAHVFAGAALQLQRLAGNAVEFGATRACPRPGCYRVAVEYEQEAVGRACLRAALDLCRAACMGRTFPIDEELQAMRQLADDERQGPSVVAIVEAARARGIPVDALNPDNGRYLQLGHGARQRRTLAAETDDISAVSRSITTDKHLTKRLLSTTALSRGRRRCNRL